MSDGREDATFSRRGFVAAAAAGGLFAATGARAQQMADPHFDGRVPRPAYAKDGPRLVIDEAHANFHTADGRYRPFADLMRGDGYRVERGTRRFDAAALAGTGVLVIANAGSPNAAEDAVKPAFDEAECDAVAEWVRGGGSLLLIADHAPFGVAAQNLARRLRVSMGQGWAFDRGDGPGKITSQLEFSRENGLLGDHAILRGRDATEAISKVKSFTGQSLVAPEGATVLLKLSPTAREAPSRAALDASAEAAKTGGPGASVPVGGRAQGLAMTFGKGRAVVLGEAAMLSAQVVRFPDGGEVRIGMNTRGYDDRQFALNVARWLSRALD